jgi:hypothetical protein
VRVLTKNAVGAERRASSFLLTPHGVGLDAADQLGDLGGDLLLREVLPARKRREYNGLSGGEVADSEFLAGAIGLVFERAVEKRAMELLTLQKRVNTVDSGPVLGRQDEAFLGAVRQ